MKLEFSKGVGALLRRLAATSYERELRGLLGELEGSFARWRRGEIESIALAEEVDRFARGPVRRRLEQRYEGSRILHMNVAQAIVRGVLGAEEVPVEVLTALARPIEFYRKGLADGTISFEPEED
jgi:hypothetical protein